MTRLDHLREKVMESCRTGYTPDRALKNLEDEYRKALGELVTLVDIANSGQTVLPFGKEGEIWDAAVARDRVLAGLG